MRRIHLCCLLLLLILPQAVAAQATGTITGVVVGTGNRPLAGAAVAVAGTNRGDQTDAQGRVGPAQGHGHRDHVGEVQVRLVLTLRARVVADQALGVTRVGVAQRPEGVSGQ